MKTSYLHVENCVRLFGFAESIVYEWDAQLRRLNSTPDLPSYGIVDAIIESAKATKNGDFPFCDNINFIASHTLDGGRILYDIFQGSERTLNSKSIPSLVYHRENSIDRTIVIPLVYACKSWGKLEGHSGYEHEIDGKSYIGITKHSWQKRFKEHLQESSSGSKKLFHVALQNLNGDKPNLMTVLHKAGLTYDDAMKWEEDAVELFDTFGPKGYNMIPGGYAGIRYLGQLNLISGSKPSLQLIDDALTKIATLNIKCPHFRKGHFRTLSHGTKTWVSPCYIHKIKETKNGTIN